MEGKVPTDWSGQCAAKIRKIVSKNACPTCGVRAGLPCQNMNSSLPEPWELIPDKKRKFKKQKRDLYYFSFIHAARRKTT
jgi:hypothetical protein